MVLSEQPVEVTNCSFFCCHLWHFWAKVVGAILNVFMGSKGIICVLIINATLILKFQLVFKNL